MTPHAHRATLVDRRTVEALVRGWPGYAVLAAGDGGWYVASDALRSRLGSACALPDTWQPALADLVRDAASVATGRTSERPIPGTNLRLSAVTSQLDTSEALSLLLVAIDEGQPEGPPSDDERHRTRDQSVARLVGSFVHDFNNLLTVMLSIIDDLHGLAEHHPERREDLAELSRSALAATSLTRQLLAFSRRRHSAPTVLEVDTMLLANQKLMRRVIGETLSLTLELDSAHATVNLDPTDFDDILVDLLGALAAVLPLGGTMQVGTTCLPGTGGGDFVNIRLEAQRSAAGEDWGSCPSPPRRDLSVSSSTRALVERYGGVLHVSTHAGRAAVIELSLPIASPQATHPTGAAMALPLLRILVVEDDPFLLRYVAGTLRKAGHDVTTAPGGQAAIDVLEGGAAAFDLLLADVVLPGVAGPVVWETFRQHHPDGRVLFMSGHTADVITSVGDRPLLSKPFTARQLLAAVDEVGRSHASLVAAEAQ